MKTVYLGLGANRTNRTKYIKTAISMLDEIDGLTVKNVSSLYETEPWGTQKNQPQFINAVCEVDTNISAEELLKQCNNIEKKLGRSRETETHWGERNIDIDILFYGDEIINQPNLVIPHKYLQQRAFVLIPLKEIAPNFIHPVFNKTVSMLYNELGTQEKVVLYEKV